MPAPRTLTYLVATSLDGYIAGPGGDISAFPVVGDHIDWLLENKPETLPGPFLQHVGVTASNNTFDTVVMGWNTFALGFDAGLDNPYPTLDQYVLSTSHDQREVGPAVTLTSGDPGSLVRRLKAEPGGGIWLAGGGQLAASLQDEIDRLVLKVNPIILGDGVPVFASPHPWGGGLALESSLSFTSGVVINTYVRA